MMSIGQGVINISKEPTTSNLMRTLRAPGAISLSINIVILELNDDTCITYMYVWFCFV